MCLIAEVATLQTPLTTETIPFVNPNNFSMILLRGLGEIISPSGARGGAPEIINDSLKFHLVHSGQRSGEIGVAMGKGDHGRFKGRGAI